MELRSTVLCMGARTTHSNFNRTSTQTPSNKQCQPHLNKASQNEQHGGGGGGTSTMTATVGTNRLVGVGGARLFCYRRTWKEGIFSVVSIAIVAVATTHCFATAGAAAFHPRHDSSCRRPRGNTQHHHRSSFIGTNIGSPSDRAVFGSRRRLSLLLQQHQQQPPAADGSRSSPSEIAVPPPQPKGRRRRSKRNRKPRYYWSQRSNLEREFRSFWTDDCGIDVEMIGTAKGDAPPPTIPNETLLMHFRRHDLRGAIVANGGREELAEMLGGAAIMPGRWKDAVRDCWELRHLTESGHFSGLSADWPPKVVATSPNDGAEAKGVGRSEKGKDDRIAMKWSHRSTRKPKGYWTMMLIIQNLYEYVDTYRLENGRPSVWMPRPSELSANGRDDLKQAMNRFGGADRICNRAGMVPYKEWFYFEGQRELILELIRYCDQYQESDYTQFPSVSQIYRNGHRRLHSLIQVSRGASRQARNALHGA